MSVLDKFSGLFGSVEPIETVAEFDLSSNPIIAQSEQLFSAEFGRDGADLVLSNFGQPDIRVPDYFNTESPADIHTADGKVLAGDVVEKLAGPEFPAQYAQAGTASDTSAIGQVESLSGTVSVQRASGVRETLSPGAKVFANDVVQTGDGGALSLTFLDGTIFTLAESSRMVLDSLIYDPASSENSGVFNLVEGAFVFIAGEVAKTGGMEVKTPAATMGIRGTTVLVRISASNGEVEVEVSLNQDPDGALGQFTITGLDGSVIADVDSTATKWLISPVEGQTREVARTAGELANDQAFLNQAFNAHRIANQRVDDGGEFVETDAGGPQEPQAPTTPEDDLNAPQEAPPTQPDNQTPEPDPEEDDQRGDLGSGIDTELANDRTQPDTIDDGVVITRLVTGGDVTPIAPFVPTNEPVAPTEEDADIIPTEPRLVDPINTTPEIIPPTQETVVIEDGSVVLQGFNIADPQNDILTARISAGSTLTLSRGSGVTIVQGTGVDESFTIIQGTGAQITDALNGATYRPTADADVSGTLTVEVSDGEFSTTQVMVIDIIPVQDAPVARPDVLQAGQNASGITGNLLANDFDVDTNPAVDQLSVLSVTIDGVTHDLNGGTISVILAGGAQFTIRPDGSYVFDTNNAYAALGEGQIHNETIEYTLSDGHETDHGQSITGQVNVEITGVNDAPVLSGDGQISVSEGQIVTLTQADLHAQDVDNTAPDLVYSLTSVPANGHLELAGASGVPITSFTQQQIDDGDVVYVHNGSEGTDDTFSFTVTDGIATVSGDFDVAITQINDDPSGTGLPISLTIVEDSAASLDLSSLQLSDPDAGESIVTLTLGVENASIVAQSTSSVTVTVTANGLIIEGSIADLNAALSDNTFITLTPDEDLSGTGAATVTVSINDNGNTGVGGGQDVDIGTIAVNITPANDAPVLTATGSVTGYTEGDQPTTIATSITIDDADTGDVISEATVSISSNFEVGDVLAFVNTANITGSYDPATGILTLTGNDTAANYEAALESIVYSSTSENPSEQTRTISFQVADGDGELSDIEVGASVQPDAVNDAPVIATLDEFDVTEGEPGELTFTGPPISDVDAEDGLVTLTLTVDNGSLDFPAGTGITISGNTLTGTIADLNQYLVHGGTGGASITFTSTLGDTTPVTLTLTVNDQGNSGGPALTDSATTTINIGSDSSAPVLTATGGTTAYTEGDQPTTIATSITIDDPDEGDFISEATVSISSNFEVGDVLAFVNTANITGSYDPATGILTLTGNDTAAAYEAALESITYSNNTENPSEQTRSISFQVADGDGEASEIEIGAVVEPDAINDVPIVATLDNIYITEDETAELTFSGTPITDVDAGSGEVTLTFNVELGTLDFPAGTGITISGNTLTGTIADLNQYLVHGGDDGDFITYTPQPNDNSSVTLTLTVNDQGNSGGRPQIDTGSMIINIDPENDAPVLTATGGTTDYTEGDQPTTIVTSITIDDPDEGDFISEATVSISSNFEVGDILTFINTANITGSYDAATGILTLTGNDTAGAYEAALESIVYSNTTENPSEQTRTITFQVADGDGELSQIEIGASVEPDAINDAPVIDTLPEFDIREDEPTAIIFNSNTLADVDAGNGEVTLTITVGTGSLTFPAGTGITISGNTLTGTIANLNQYLTNGGDNGDFLTYTPEQDDTNSATLTLTVNDQGNSGGPPQIVTVNTAIHISPQNDAPVVIISSSTQNYTENGEPALIDPDLQVQDVDDTNIESARVTIVSGLESPTDFLSFTETSNITGSYDPTTGVLTLTGTNTLANYQAILRTVTFDTSSGTPSETDRVIEIVVNDGDDDSNVGTVTVSVDATNSAPVINLDTIAAGPELVLNGGFEAGTTITSGSTILTAGSTDITNWTVTDDNIDYIQDPTGTTVGEGERAVRLNGDEPGAISTMIDTEVGRTYEISFQGRNDGTFEVLATGGTIESYTSSSDANGLYHSYTFTATVVMTTLTFTSTTAGSFGVDIDDVTMRLVVGATVQVLEDTPIEISDIQISDADATPDAVFTVTLTSSYGLITVNPEVLNGLEAAGIAGNGTYSVTLTGTLFDINTTLAVADGVTYTPNLDFNGDDAIVVNVNDGGSSGPGGPQTDTATINLNVQAVDDSVPSHADIGDVVEGDEPNLTGIQFVGEAGDTVGYSVSNVGDINNDGIDDFAVGSAVSSGESGTPTLSGSVYVIYGAAGSNPYATLAYGNGEVGLDNLASAGLGFELVGAASGDRAGFSVSGGGDLNNDGISDIVIGAHFVDSPINSGGAYVIYGGQDFGGLADSTTGEISLSRVGVTGRGNLDGFEINHFYSNAELGYDVNLTGDLNNDGIADLIVSSSDRPGLDFSGTWVVFGGQDFASAVDPTTGAFDVASIGNALDGFILQGEVAGDFAGLSVDIVSDFNGDGVDDLLIGAPGHSGTAIGGGVSYVIYGGQDWTNIAGGGSDPTISLSNIGAGIGSLGGFRIASDSDSAELGTVVSNAGDVDGDGIGDLLVTAPGNAEVGPAGTAYIVYGGQNLTGTVLTSTIGSTVGGAAFTEPANRELVTHATALGDIDGDGYSDILVGVKLADDVSSTNIGRAYVIYGSSAPSTGTHSLADVGTTIDGFQLIGESANDLFGERAQSVGDVNSDGYNDFIVTAIGNDDGGNRAGAAYLVYGSDFDNRLDQVSGADEETGGPGRNIIHGTPGDDVINGGGGGDIITTGAGDDVITIGNGFIDFIDAGSGTDTLIFGDAGSFDLTNINDLRLQSIEALDTTNGLVNDVTLSITDIFQISDDANAELETLLGTVLPTSFIIDADANDTFTFENGSAGGIWTLNTGLSAGMADHNVYEYVAGGSGDVLATLAIDDEVTPTIV